jgi:hypothetical protein
MTRWDIISFARVEYGTGSIPGVLLHVREEVAAVVVVPRIVYLHQSQEAKLLPDPGDGLGPLLVVVRRALTVLSLERNGR